MKHLSAIAAIALFITACGNKYPKPDCPPAKVTTPTQKSSTEPRLFASGTYVATYETPIAFDTDTMRVEKIMNTATMYTITRKTAYQQILAGITQLPDVYTQQWTGSYDAATKTMYVLATGYRIRYNTAGALDFDGAAYTKVE
ncbi:putative small lipoprotein YifL [Filimonas zeae]|uniref:Uncharacterized protein n=1 Tax=Filimonas zeae TaxID=1737353 RepID=A0A917INR2_9BACT|nr:hypothetical protein [Filimonas zeae]MDR6337686.1 putative small lipoprotein YifL [Filimonas zeae]GGH59781.1 hypothetical protein GCM10011379_06940 [Filimonas zeae]